MEQYIVADAAAFGNDIRATGHAAVYGIHFDTGKSTIKPESAQAIGEIAKLLKADPGLKIHVVGHTDNVGGVDSNIKLSQDRAEAVLQALVRDHGIAPARLRAYGCGRLRPLPPTTPRRAGPRTAGSNWSAYPPKQQSDGGDLPPFLGQPDAGVFTETCTDCKPRSNKGFFWGEKGY